MKKSSLLGAALALSTANMGASVAASRNAPPSPTVLYNQNYNFGQGIVSDNFSSTPSYDSIGADDFWVPPGQTWRVTEVDVTGAYANGSGPASSVVVTFYRTGLEFPQRIAQHGTDRFTLSCTDNNGSFACTLPLNSRGEPVVQLRGGSTGNGLHYWLSVVANCDFATCGEWDWATNTTVYNTFAQWKNPGGGWGISCGGWGNLRSCFDIPSSDFAFDLVGYK